MFLQRFSSRDLSELFAYEDEYGPLDVASRLDYLFAHLGATIAAIFAKEPRDIEVRDFLVRWGGRPVLSSAQEAALGRGMMSVLEGPKGRTP